jgi:TRAP-type transport system small permease protein
MMAKFYQRLCAAQAWIAAVLLIAMVVLIFMAGVMRLIGEPINWSVDAATAFFSWACFLCADIAWRNNALMSIELITSRLPDRLQRAFLLVNYAIITAFLIYLMIMGTHLAWISRARSFQGIPEVSYAWVTLSLPVGALLLLITTALKVRAVLRGERIESHATDVV